MKLSKRDVVLAGLGAITYLASQSGEAATTSAHPAGEGYAPVVGGRVWWRVARSGPRTPLLLLHGGPGAGHERSVIFYDQLGCGRSDKPEDASMWHIEHFVEEIDALRQALRLHHVVLYGHSWGGRPAQEYLARRGGAAHVDALIPASTWLVCGATSSIPVTSQQSGHVAVAHHVRSTTLSHTRRRIP